MKSSKSKRILTLLLAAVMVLSCISGCTRSLPVESQPQANISADAQTTTPEPTEATMPSAPQASLIQGSQGTMVVAPGQELKYVLIYNPQIYLDDLNTNSHYTGDLASQIDIEMFRADGLGEDPDVIPYSQQDLTPEFMEKVDLSGGKADGLAQFYRVGDQQTFYCGANQRYEQLFTCAYAGTHANIWVYTQLDQNILNNLGAAFDATIYDDCVSRFGEPRFGEVVNFLIYPMESDPNTIGFFHNIDLFSSFEVNDETAVYYGANRDHNVVNINSLWLEDEIRVTSTLAHEFQHLLCFTGYFTAGNLCDVWFNEAMSGYIEEALYPGIKESSYNSFHLSDLIRNGQSLYNFRIDITPMNVDIGVYGSVFLFAEYLRNLVGEDVFSNFHSNWRNTYTPLTTLQGIYQIIPEDVRMYIDTAITYPDSYVFTSPEEEWISKLTLSFYLSLLTMDQYTNEYYRQIQLPYLLYDSLMEANIEGGGRLIMAVKNGQFQIPANADKGLVYVGLNENMEIVTNICCN